MKVLMLSPTLPWPLNMGSKIRIFHTLKELVRAGHEVNLVTLSSEPYSYESVEVLKSYCAELCIISIENRPRVKAALRALLSSKPYRVAKFESSEFRFEVTRALRRDYDLLWVHFMETLAYVSKNIFGSRRPLVVLDQHNADECFWETYVRQGPPWVRLFALQNLWKLRRFQRSLLQRVEVILSVSEEDAKFTRGRLTRPSTKVWVVPNGVDVERLQLSGSKEERENRVIFCGTMDALMNIDAVEWFAYRIFPKVQQAIPDIEFWIVGRNPSPKVLALKDIPGIHVTGDVEDIRPYYAKAKVAVAPFRYGGGTKLKVLEAMALGVPLVATPVGCQGIEAISGEHLFIEKNEKEFAQRVIMLLQNEELREHITIRARQHVEEKYSWQSILQKAITRLEHMVMTQKV